MEPDEVAPSREQLEKVYRDRIDWQSFRRGSVPPAVPQEHKTLVMVCGPMGAGKTNAAEHYKAHVQEDFESYWGSDSRTRGYVHLDMDDMRAKYPGYQDLARGVQGGFAVGAKTQAVATEWFNRAIASALDGDRNVVVEGTRPYRSTLRHARSRGYRVVVAVVVCSEAEARSGVLGRYLRQIDLSKQGDPTGQGWGRNVPAAIQKRAFDSLLPGLKAAQDEQRADEIHLHERFGSRPTYSARLERQEGGERRWMERTYQTADAENWAPARPVDEPFVELRDRPWTPEYATVMEADIAKMGRHELVRSSGILTDEHRAITEMARPKIAEARRGPGPEAGMSAGTTLTARPERGHQHDSAATPDLPHVRGGRTRHHGPGGGPAPGPGRRPLPR